MPMHPRLRTAFLAGILVLAAGCEGTTEPDYGMSREARGWKCTHSGRS